MSISLTQFQQAAECSRPLAEVWHPVMVKAMEDWDISTPRRAAGFIAQIAHECRRFTRLVESLNYSPQGLAETWRHHFAHKTPAKIPSPNELAIELGRTPYHQCDEKAIANLVYGGRYGNVSGTDDGWLYRGRGPKQITFRDNYAECGTALGLDLVANPDLLLEPTNGAQSAGWFWSSRGCNPLMEAGDFMSVTKRINGGLIGYERRVQRLAVANHALGVV